MSLSAFRKAVARALTREHGWGHDRATAWITEHHDYMRAMWTSAAPVWQTADYIAHMISDS